MNVLITGCSKHSKEIVDCLKDNEDGIPVEVTGINMDANRLLRHGPDYQYVVPPITDDSYIPTLLDICKERNIDVIIPYITAELELLAEKKPLLEENGIKVSVAEPKTISILNSKERMYENFGYYMPRQFVVDTVEETEKALLELGYPDTKVCCKISGKCGGTGFCILDDDKCYDISLFNRNGINRYIGKQELLNILRRGAERIILQEYISGIDYSVCVLADKGKVFQKVGYCGYDMEFGAVVNGEIKTNMDAIRMASEVARETELDGNACFDFILQGDRAFLLECNPRINASIGFCAKAGVNLVWLRCKQLVDGMKEGYFTPKEGLRMQKYYESEYYFI